MEHDVVLLLVGVGVGLVIGVLISVFQRYLSLREGRIKRKRDEEDHKARGLTERIDKMFRTIESSHNVSLGLVALVTLSVAVVVFGGLRAATMGGPYPELVGDCIKPVLGVTIGILSYLLFLELLTRRKR